MSRSNNLLTRPLTDLVPKIIRLTFKGLGISLVDPHNPIPLRAGKERSRLYMDKTTQTMVSILSTMTEEAISLLSEEQKEAFSVMMVPVLTPPETKRKKNNRTAFVSGLAAWKTGKERKESYVAKASEDRRIHVMEGASKDEAGKMYDSISSIGEKALIEDLGKSVPAGIAFVKGGKVVTTTSAAATIATLSALERLRAAKHGSKEYREAVAAVEAIKEG